MMNQYRKKPLHELKMVGVICDAHFYIQTYVRTSVGPGKKFLKRVDKRIKV